MTGTSVALGAVALRQFSEQETTNLPPPQIKKGFPPPESRLLLSIRATKTKNGNVCYLNPRLASRSSPAARAPASVFRMWKSKDVVIFADGTKFQRWAAYGSKRHHPHLRNSGPLKALTIASDAFTGEDDRVVATAHGRSRLLLFGRSHPTISTVNAVARLEKELFHQHAIAQ